MFTKLVTICKIKLDHQAPIIIFHHQWASRASIVNNIYDEENNINLSIFYCDVIIRNNLFSKLVGDDKFLFNAFIRFLSHLFCEYWTQIYIQRFLKMIILLLNICLKTNYNMKNIIGKT